MDGLTDYERQRLENIQRNNARLAQLGMDLVLDELRAVATPKRGPPKGYKRGQKRAREVPMVLRRSLRTKRMSPYSKGLEAGSPQLANTSNERALVCGVLVQGPRPMVTVRMTETANSECPVDFPAVLRKELAAQPHADRLWKSRFDYINDERVRERVRSLNLDKYAVAKIVPDRVSSLLFLHLRSRVIVAAGDKAGHVGFWDTESGAVEWEGVHIFRPHSDMVSGIASSPNDYTKLLTSSSDGFVLLMDVDKAEFSQIYHSHESLSAVTFAAHSDAVVAYVAEGEGSLKVLDARLPALASSYKLHDRKINSIDVHSGRPYSITTSSADGRAAIWDARNLKGWGTQTIAELSHNKSVHSAYFSPSGHQVATTSYDDHVRLWKPFARDKDEDNEVKKIYHYNQINRWIAPFRAIWGWNDNLLFIGNKAKSIDVFSAVTRTSMGSLSSHWMTRIPYRLACHPLLPGCIVGGSWGGEVYIWQA